MRVYSINKYIDNDTKWNSLQIWLWVSMWARVCMCVFVSALLNFLFLFIVVQFLIDIFDFMILWIFFCIYKVYKKNWIVYNMIG